MMSPSGPGVVLGHPVGPFAMDLAPARLAQFAAAIAANADPIRRGEVVPPAFLVTQIWEAQEAGRQASVPRTLQAAATGGVHGEHDIVVHRVIRPGERLQVWVEGHGARPAGRNSAVTLRYTAKDRNGHVVVEQWWTTVFFGVTCGEVGAPAPDHAFPAGARERPVGTFAIEVDPDMARRYAEVSGDWSPHHFDLEAAIGSGFDRLFLHGLCTLSLCAQGVAEIVAGGDPERLRRVAVRFATPAFLGEQLSIPVFDAGPQGYAFEAHSAGMAVITHGRAEVR